MIHNFTAADLAAKSLGPCRIDSPLPRLLDRRQRTFHYVDEEDRVFFDDTCSGLSERNLPVDQLPAFEPADCAGRNEFTNALRRGGKIAVVGVPNTIDNDPSFGFQTAFAETKRDIRSAHAIRSVPANPFDNVYRMLERALCPRADGGACTLYGGGRTSEGRVS